MKFVNAVEGAEDLKAMLKTVIPRESKNLLRRVTFDIARDLREEIRAGAPEGATGVLHEAIIPKRNRGTPGTVEASVTITKGRTAIFDAWYWHFIEFGTVLKAARPFIVPASERMRARLGEIFRDKFGKQLEKLLAKSGKGSHGGHG